MGVGWVVQAKCLLHFKALILQMSMWLMNFKPVCYWVGRTILWPVDQGLEISTVRGILWTPHWLDLKTHVSPSTLRSKELPIHTEAKVPTLSMNWAYQWGLQRNHISTRYWFCAWEEGALRSFTHRAVMFWEGTQLLDWSGCHWLAIHKHTVGQCQTRAQVSTNQILKHL